MYDETTAASIVSALRRWAGSSSSNDPVGSEGSDVLPSVQGGLEWTDRLKGIAHSGPIELNPLVENLSEALGGARVVFEPASSASFGAVRPTLDVGILSGESRTSLSPGHDLSTPISALQPGSAEIQTVLKLTAKSIYDGVSVPVRSWASGTTFGVLHVEWPRRPRVAADEMRWRLIAIAQLITDSCVADEQGRLLAEPMKYLLDELRTSRDASLLVDGDTILFANDAAARLCCVSEKQLRETSLAVLLTNVSDEGPDLGGDGDRSRRAYALNLPDSGVRLIEIDERTVSRDKPNLRIVRIFEPEAAVRARQRALLESLTEAVWQVELRAPLKAEGLDTQVLRDAIERSYLTECNARMTDFIRQMVQPGDTVEPGDVMAFLGEGILREFIKGGLRARNVGHKLRSRDGSWRHFVVSLQAVRRDGQVTHIIGNTLETTAYVEVEQRTVSALEKQREDLGRELHDVVGQLLTGIRLLSSNLARDVSLSPEKIRLHATRVSQMAEEAHLNLRQINRGLSAAHLQHVRLDDALHDLAEFVGTMPTVDCTFDYEETVAELDPEKKLQVYRIAQEAVNNALKHSRATQVVIQWRQTDDGLVLAVADNGVGFDEQELDRKTLGLHSMRYRAKVVGAELSIRSSAGHGTTVRCLLPV